MMDGWVMDIDIPTGLENDTVSLDKGLEKREQETN